MASDLSTSGITEGILALNDVGAPSDIGAIMLFGGGPFIQKGDIILSINGQTTITPDDLDSKLSNAGRRLELFIWRPRQGKIHITLG
jgi:S1-C subfamily serine protease